MPKETGVGYRIPVSNYRFSIPGVSRRTRLAVHRNIKMSSFRCIISNEFRPPPPGINKQHYVVYTSTGFRRSIFPPRYIEVSIYDTGTPGISYLTRFALHPLTQTNTTIGYCTEQNKIEVSNYQNFDTSIERVSPNIETSSFDLSMYRIG